MQLQSCDPASPLCLALTAAQHITQPVQPARPAERQTSGKRECFLLTWCPDSVQQHVRQVLAELRRNCRIVWKRDADVTGLLIQSGLCWAEPLACVEMGPNLC